METLKFCEPNAKTIKLARKMSKIMVTFSTPCGYSCPNALNCKAHFDQETRKLVRGDQAEVTCYAALEEGRPNVADPRWHNFRLLNNCKTSGEVFDLLDCSLPKYNNLVRMHPAGDMHRQIVVDAWRDLAISRPKTVFYGYTKSISMVLAAGQLPSNLVLNGSFGGKEDDLLEKSHLKKVEVVFHPDEAKKKGLKIDHDDSLAVNPRIKRFAVLIHGTQKAGSMAAKAIQRLKNENIDFSYGKE